MIVVLDNHLAELQAQVVVELRGHVVAYERNLFPDEQATAVGFVEHVVGLWVVGETNRVDTHLLDDVKVGVVLFLLEGGGILLPVLMARNATEFERTAIEEEALVLVNPEVTQTDGVLHAVHLLAIALQHGDDFIKVGVGGAVPKMGTVDGYVDESLVAIDTSRTAADHGIALGIEHGELHFATLVVALSRKVYLGRKFGTLLIDEVLVNEESVRTVIER